MMTSLPALATMLLGIALLVSVLDRHFFNSILLCLPKLRRAPGGQALRDTSNYWLAWRA